MPTALLVGYPHHVRAIARFVNQYATRWRLVAEGVDLASRNRAVRWIPFVDALVAFGGPAPDALLTATTRRRGKPIAVAWAGSDVVELREQPEEVARIRCRPFRHVACSASLARELCEIGIPATELRLVVAEPPTSPAPLPERFSVLAYCPGNGERLYGVDIILDVALRLPHIHFDIIGGCSAASILPNVAYHGWVEDIVPAIDAATVILRPTRHDGMPLMVLEALARGRHVIWSRPLTGVLQACSADEIAAHIAAMESAHRDGLLGTNADGLRAIAESFSPEAVTRVVESFLDELVNAAEIKRENYAAVSRRKAVVSGDPAAVAAFLRRMSQEAPQWDLHPLIGRSRSERVDDALAMFASERWFSLGDATLHPVVAGVARACRKEPMSVRLDEEGILERRSPRTRRRSGPVHLTPEEWRAYDAAHPAPTFFARPAWGFALERTYFGLRSDPMLFALPEGEALFTCMRSGRRFVSYEAMPLGTYALALSPDGGVAETRVAAAIARTLKETSDDFTCTYWPLVENVEIDGCNHVEHQTAVIDLRGGMEAAIGGFKGVARRMAGQAVRKGVTVAREQNGADTYYRLLEESARRWGLGRPHLPKIIFDALVELGREDVEVWIARYRGEAIAGGVMVYGSKEAFFWSAAMRGEFSSLRPSNLLNLEMVKAAVERGMDWYNLGASEGLSGVERFKESLGAEPIDYTTYSWQSPFYRKYQRVRSVLERRRSASAISVATI